MKKYVFPFVFTIKTIALGVMKNDGFLRVHKRPHAKKNFDHLPLDGDSVRTAHALAQFYLFREKLNKSKLFTSSWNIDELE